MEKIELPLDQMTQAQKLDIMETLWEDMTKDTNTFESPTWHKDILQDRHKAFTSGKVSISSWDEAKERIKRNVACK